MMVVPPRFWQPLAEKDSDGFGGAEYAGVTGKELERALALALALAFNLKFDVRFFQV